MPKPPAASSPTWTPALGDSWQWQLSGKINTGYAARVYDLDLVDTPASTISALHARGVHVVCYFSAGSAENWRPDYSDFLPADMGNTVDGWAGERWLDTRSVNVRRIMTRRLDQAVGKGCDGVEPDNVDAYANNPGLALSAVTQLDYNRFIARQAKSRGLAVGLKNDIAQIPDLAPEFDFAVNEQCFEFSECSAYSVLTSAAKPVFNAEYSQRYRANKAGARDELCTSARAMNLHTLVLSIALDDSYRYSCD